MLARTKQGELAQSRGLVVGRFDEHLAMLLVEQTKSRCATVHWIRNLDCQYIKRLNWRKYRCIVCSMDFYQQCLHRLNLVAGLIEITIILTDKREFLSLVLLPVPASIKKKFFLPETRRFANTVSL
ncbi:hypothetical protein HGA34_04315 [Candidatus Falkowbacteria bacterium]|nr:hypothetical protein [Candidatus Falkowbacteria bacterium]